MATISGVVTYLEPIRLPAHAEVVVTLEDVGRMDAPSRLVGSTQFDPQGRPPFRFDLTYDPALIEQRGRYAIRARIEADGRLLFTSTQTVPAFSRDADEPIVLSRVTARREPAATGASTSAHPTTDLLDTYWRLVAVDGRPATPGAGGTEVHLVLEGASGRVRGSSGCNTFSGSFELTGPTLAFGPLASTRRICMEGMEQERAVLAALHAVVSHTIEADTLVLRDPSGTVRLRLAAVALA